MELGTIKTTTRVRNGVTQIIKLFSKKQKQIVINAVGNREGTILEVLDGVGVSPVVYHSWIRNLKPKQNKTKGWNIQINGENEKDVIILLEKLTSIFEIPAKTDNPLHFVSFEINNVKLTCTENK